MPNANQNEYLICASGCKSGALLLAANIENPDSVNRYIDYALDT
jgi:hypothetical protein